MSRCKVCQQKYVICDCPDRMDDMCCRCSCLIADTGGDTEFTRKLAYFLELSNWAIPEAKVLLAVADYVEEHNERINGNRCTDSSSS